MMFNRYAANIVMKTLVAALVCVVTAWTIIASAQEEPRGPEAAAPKEVSPLDVEAEPDRHQEKPPATVNLEKEKAKFIGLLALLGIILCGMGLAALTMIWGARVRRMVRSPLKSSEAMKNEFWFLKPTKSPELEPPTTTDPTSKSTPPPE